MADDRPDGDKESLAERVARKLAENRDKAPAPTVPPVVVRQEPAESAAGPAPEPVPEDSKITDSTSADGVIQINFDRLHAAGYITPETGRSQAIEEFRFIKRQILRTGFTDNNEKINETSNVIMITSALPGDGKSFVALNVAISFSLERDFFVLLVDADTHRHGLTDLFGVNQQDAGLVDLLVDQRLQMRDIIRRTSIPTLSFIAAGRPHLHGTEILASKQMAATLQDLTRRYPDRIIIIDTPPILIGTEGVVLSQHVGHAVVVVEQNRTPKKALSDALERLEGCAEVSCVLHRDAVDQIGFGES